MTALVTGATGFVGSHLVERLLAEGVAVRCLVRPTSSLRHLPASRIQLAGGDVVTGSGLREAVAGVDVIFHLAGVTKARRPADFYAGNARGTANLVAAGADVARFVHVSSLAAAGPSAEGMPLREDDAPHPLTHYGKSKLESERIVLASPVAARAAILRPPVVFGPRDTDVLHIFRMVARGRMVGIGRGERWFSYIYVKDLAEALLAAARSTAAGTWFASHPEPVSWTAFGALAGELLGRPVRPLAIPPPMAYAVGFCAEIWSRLAAAPVIISREKVAEACRPYWTCDATRARVELGFSARTGLREGVAETLAWYKKAGWLK